MDWNNAFAVTRGSQLGAILRAAMGENAPGDNPQFASKAFVTSDGFVHADFIDKNGDGHSQAFIGSASELSASLHGLAEHLKLTAEERTELAGVVRAWIATDYRGSARGNDFWAAS